ncbi:MAG: dTMP kinase [Bacteroidota bacterium]|nr:dTMP kinase [Bacteroidota bacterium]
MALLVIEGLDGAGKSTQVGMLQNYLKERGMAYEYLHFPRTDSPVYGDLVARFLRGELGDLNAVNPYLVALIYAGDRADARVMLEGWLAKGTTIILDRYVYSNIAYQCAKLQDEQGRVALKSWILDTEFGYFKLPKPDLNIFLDVPFNFTKNKLTSQRSGDDRSYLNGQRDIHEEDLGFQGRVREVYLSLENEERFVRIDCSGGGQSMLPPGEIFKKIAEKLDFYNALK